MLKYSYGTLNSVQKGYFGEAYAKMAFTLAGFEVYSSDFDDRGIDFLARWKDKVYLVQVKTTGPKANPFIYEKKFQDRNDFLFVAVRLELPQPTIWVARRSDWGSEATTCLKTSGGGRSGEYYEISFAAKYADVRSSFAFNDYLIKRLGCNTG